MARATRVMRTMTATPWLDGVVITCGVPLGSPGATNMIRLAFVDEHGLPDGHSPDYIPTGGKVPMERRTPTKVTS